MVGFYLVLDKFFIRRSLRTCGIDKDDVVDFFVYEWELDESRPSGRRFHTVKSQNKVQTYQFDEINSN